MDNSERPFIIPVFLPHLGCPHQCAFCNQTAITSSKSRLFSPETLRLRINKFLEYKGKRRNRIQVSFYGGNFLGLKKDEIKSLLDEAARFVKAGRVDSLRFSTRPDTIDVERLDILNDYPVSTIELGVQSMDDHVLKTAKRGHSALDTEKAIGLLKDRNYEIGLQMMVGLPDDDENKALASGRRIADFAPDFVRIYPTVVLAGSPLAAWYKKGKYVPFSLEKCVTLVKKLYLLFNEKNITVIRMGLQASEDLDDGSTILAGPYHPAFGHLVFSEIFLDRATALLKNHIPLGDTMTIRVHPRSIPKMRGLKNSNINILRKKFQFKTLNILPDAGLAEESVVI
jgi:histone acetyltransferase (RNA polymerase elongator complex component)